MSPSNDAMSLPVVVQVTPPHPISPDLVRYLASGVKSGNLSRGLFAAWVGCDRCDVDAVALGAGVTLP
jgi:hypothetical protein